ncbi:MAG: PD40 domain-containing protein [Bacteroidales bacterium]|nr:PD40 domain-containing protein [Bacteroidales bacterium]
MKKTISLTILLLGCVFLCDKTPAQNLSDGAQKNERRADSLYHRYEFARARDIYAQMAQTAEAQDKNRLELKSIACQNGQAMLQYVSSPTIVTRKVQEKKDFYLYYPKISSVGHFIHAPQGLPSTSDTLYLPDDKNTLYYSTKTNNGDWDIFITRKQEDGSWSAPEALGNTVNSKGNDIFPFLSPDGKRLYFSSNGHYGAGGYDLYVSVWDEAEQKWGLAQNMGFPYSSPSDDLFFYITPDGKYAAFSSTRSLDDPTSRLYSPTRILSYVVDYEEEPVKHRATPEEAYELSRLRSGSVMTQKQRDSINNAAVAKALEGVERKSGLAEMDSSARKTTERYTAATQKYRTLKSQQEKLQSSQAAYRLLYSGLGDRLMGELEEEDAALKRDSLEMVKDRIAQSETAMYTVSQQLREVEKEIRAIEDVFMSTGVVVPSSNAFKTADQLKAETETGVAQEEEENIANLLSVKSPIEESDDFKVERIRPKVDLNFKIQKKGMLVDLEDLPDGLIYQIRFLSSSKKLTEASFKGLSPVFERTAGGRYTYSAGAFTSYSDAYRQLSRVKKAGFASATIVAFENGNAIPLEVARKKEAPAQKTTSQKGKKGTFNVVILSDESSLDPEVKKLVQASGKDIAKTSSAGNYKFICGPFSSQKDAEDLASKIKAASDKKVSVESVN